MTAKRLLLVEDDPNLGSILQEYLTLKGYHVTLCVNGVAGYKSFQTQSFDMCVFDIMMPVMDGFTLAQKVKEEDKDMPILFVTAKSLQKDILEGFKIGADDYVTKPFSMEELVVRIQAILRRCDTIKKQSTNNQEANENGEFFIGTYTFNPIQQTLKNKTKVTKLTTKESLLLKMLCENKNQVMERQQALQNIWGEDNYFTARSMDVFITKLRKHFKQHPSINIINVHGKGYKLIDI